MTVPDDAVLPTTYLDVVMTVLPHPEGEFVELEDDKGRGVYHDYGVQWVTSHDEYARLRIPLAPWRAQSNRAQSDITAVESVIYDYEHNVMDADEAMSQIIYLLTKEDGV